MTNTTVQQLAASKLEPQHMERLRVRAIDPAIAYREGARSLDETQVQQRTRNLKLKGSGLGYDYSHLEHSGSCRMYTRVYLDDRKANGDRKVSCPPGVLPPPFFLTSAPTAEGDWLIVESPEKALSLKSAGYAEPVGLGGVDAGLLMGDGTFELQPLAKHFIRPGHRVTVVMDAGRATNARVAAAEARLCVALRLHGCMVRVAALPPREDGGDQGPDDFIADNGAASLQAVLDAAEPGDPAERAKKAVLDGDDAVRALLSETPFQAALVVGGDVAVDAVTEALGAKFADEIKAARAVASAALARRRLFDLGDQVEVAKAVLTDLGPDTVFDDGNLYVYTEAHWKRVGAAEANRAVYRYSGAGIKGEKGIRPLRVSRDFASGSVGVATDLVNKESFFASAPAGIAFSDCFVLVDGQQLKKLRNSPDHRARHAFEFRYDEVPRCHRFKAMLDELWDGDDDRDAKKSLLQEYVGACMVGLGAKTKKVLILAGDTDSGKSTVLNVIKSVFPDGAVAAVRPAEFSDPYYRAQLVGVLCNVVSELPETDWLEPSAFKALTGDDLINARSPYGKPFSFVAKAGHLYAANALPRIADRSEASWNRLLILAFNNRFYAVPAEGQKAQVRGLAEAILEHEREGVVAWAVEGLRRLLAKKMVLTDVGSSEEAVQTLRNESDQLRLFFDDRLELEATANPEIDQVYAVYKAWAQHTRNTVLNLQRFAREFVPLLRQRTGQQKVQSQNSRKNRTYKGIKINKKGYDGLYLEHIT